MKVVFSASNYNLQEHYPTFQKIIMALKTAGCTLTRDWIDADMKRQSEQRNYTHDEYRAIWQEVRESMIKADLVVIEATNSSYSMGYQTAIALSLKKPVLVLSQIPNISNTIIAGEDNPLLEVAIYNDKNLLSIIQQFIEKYNVSNKDLRFNMVLDFETHNYLEWASAKTGKTKAKIIRDLIKKAGSEKSGL